MPDVIITYPSVKSSMINWRSKESSVPKIPHSMDEFISQVETDENIDKYSINDEQFIHLIPSSCERAGQSVALFTASGIKVLQQRNKTTMDGTFGFFPKFVKQLFIIHAFIGKFVSLWKLFKKNLKN